MSAETSSWLAAETRPTHVRYWVIAVATLMSVLLYLDRFAVSIASEYIREDLRMTQTQMSWFLSAFFWSYALAQVPSGWFSDRFGSRRMLTMYILAWSAFTGLLGFAHHVWLVLYLRLFMGVSQAGAYPTSAAMIRHWFPIRSRGTASSLVGLGGRFGAVLAPILTAWLMVYTGSARQASVDFNAGEIIDARRFLTRAIAIRQYPSMSDKLLAHFDPRFNDLKSWPVIDPSEAAIFQIAEIRDHYEKDLMEAEQGTLDEAIRRFVDPNVEQNERETENAICERIADGLNDALNDAQLFEVSVIKSLNLSPKSQRFVQTLENGEQLRQDEIRSLNRSLLEAAFPRDLAKLDGRGWRPTMIVYGAIGLVVALGFLVICRDTPKQHPWCNEAERNIIHDEATLAVMRTEPRDPEFPWKAMLTNVSLWGNSLMQFTTNVGWLFVVTWLPRYLDKVHGVSLVQQGIMTAVPSGVGILTLFVGGRWTDIAARRFGLKWGRRVPILLTRFSAAAGYGMCLLLSLMFDPAAAKGADFNWLPWGYVFGLSFAAASVDLGTPAVWAFAQDVGGKYTGSILGWANMWGNLGAAAAPLIYNVVLGEHPSLGQWNTMFGVCLISFVISGLCALVIDATKPLVRESSA